MKGLIAPDITGFEAEEEPIVTTLDTGNDICAVSRDSHLKFYSAYGETDGYDTKLQDGSVFSPQQTLFADASNKMLFLTPNKSDVIVRYDTETGKNLGETGVKLSREASSTVKFDYLSPAKKFAQLKSSSTHDLIALSKNTLLQMTLDPRAPGKVVTLEETDTTKPKHSFTLKRGKGFTAAATNSSGHLVVGDAAGSVRLYTDPSNGNFKRAKTQISQLADEIIGVDVSSDGEWVLWTTPQYLALVNVNYQDDKGRDVSGFKRAIPSGKRKAALLLKLSADDLQEMNITEDQVRFTPARFDNGPALDVTSDIIEEQIVTSTGHFVVQWKMRPVKNDYKAGRMMPAAEGQQRRAKIIAQRGKVLEKAFAYDSDRTLIAALANEVDALNLDSPAKSKVWSTPTKC